MNSFILLDSIYLKMRKDSRNGLQATTQRRLNVSNRHNIDLNCVKTTTNSMQSP